MTSWSPQVILERRLTSGSDLPLSWAFLGEVDYEEALALQLRLREEILAGQRGDTLLLLTHPPVITLGRSARSTNVLISHEQRRRRRVKLVRVERGGDVTFHGPGQLVGYPLRWVGRAVVAHVEAMVGAVVELLQRLGIEGRWDARRPGVWTERGKIAAVGVDARGGVAMHGFALNLTTNLSSFEMIVPCGHAAPVTSVEDFLGCDAVPALQDVARELVPGLASRFGRRPREALDRMARTQKKKTRP